MAEGIWQKFKQDIQKANGEAREKQSAIKSDFRQDAAANKTKAKANSLNVKTSLLLGIWFFIPLTIIGLILFVIGGMFVWDAIFGL